jgi:ABC-type uncharacterized transport system permease subunit
VKQRALIACTSVVLGILFCMVIVTILGENPFHVLKVLFAGAFGTLEDLGYTLFYATPLIFTGLSVAVAFQCGLFNIGAEGQLYMGALLLTIAGIYFPHVPWPLAPLFAILAAVLGGGIWGAIAGILKTYRGSHEVIVTIMLNFIAYSLAGFFIMNVFKNPLSQNPESSEIGKNYFIPQLNIFGGYSPLNVGFIFALLAAFAVWLLLFKTTWGFELRMVGASPETARRAGVRVKVRIVQAMFLSGGLAGLVAVNEILGFSHKFRDMFSSGYGFIGIAVALLGRNRPLGIIFAALLFGALQKGSLELEIDSEKITRDLSLVIQALIILFMASEPLFKKVFSKNFLRTS